MNFNIFSLIACWIQASELTATSDLTFYGFILFKPSLSV